LLGAPSAWAALKFQCDTWSEIAGSTGWTAVGKAEVSDTATTVDVKLTGVLVSTNGTVSTSSLIAHVHAEACASNAAGGHFKVNASEPTTIQTNELWAGPGGFAPAAQPATAWTGSSTVPGSFTGRTDVKAVVIHEVLADSSPKRVCCNLVAVATAAPTTAPTAAPTTAPTNAPTTAAPTNAPTTAKPTTAKPAVTTTGGSGTAAGTGDACTTDACCKGVIEKDGAKTKCESCFKRDGCTFYLVPDKNPMTTGDCVLSTSAAGGGAQTKVTELAQCTIEVGCAAIKGCYACSSEEACNWCHTSTQMLSKDEGRCVSGDCKVDETQASRINCPASASTLAVSSLAALVATVVLI